MFLTSKFSPAFRLTTERHLLAETGLFLGRRLSLGMPPGQRTGPDWLAQAFAGWTFSVSPPLGARLVDCTALPRATPCPLSVTDVSSGRPGGPLRTRHDDGAAGRFNSPGWRRKAV